MCREDDDTASRFASAAIKVRFDTVRQTEVVNEYYNSSIKDVSWFRGNASLKAMLLKSRMDAQRYAFLVKRTCPALPTVFRCAREASLRTPSE